MLIFCCTEDLIFIHYDGTIKNMNYIACVRSTHEQWFTFSQLLSCVSDIVHLDRVEYGKIHIPLYHYPILLLVDI